MSLVLKSDVVATQNLGNLYGLVGPQDFSVLADFSMQRYILGEGNTSFEELFAFTRGSDAWLINDRGEVESFGANTPRFGRVGNRKGVVVEPSSSGNAYSTGSNPQSSAAPILLSSPVNWRLRAWGAGSVTANIFLADDTPVSTTVITAQDGYVPVTVPSNQKIQFVVDDLDYIQMSPLGMALQFIPRDGDAVPKAVEVMKLASSKINLLSGSFSVLVNYAIDESTLQSGLPYLAIHSVSGPKIAGRCSTRPGGGMLAVLQYGDTLFSLSDQPTFTATALVVVDRGAGKIKLSLGNEVVEADLDPDFDATDFFLGSDPSSSVLALAGIVRKAVVFERALTDQEIEVAKKSFS